MSRWEHSFANDWLAAQVTIDPGALGLISRNQELRFSEFQHKVEQQVQALQTLGLASQVVALSLRDRRATVFLVLALQKIACIPFPLNPDLANPDRAHLLKQSNARILISDDIDKSLPASTRQLSLRQLSRAGFSKPLQPMLPLSMATVRPALILATSGSSAMPKGVMLSADNLAGSVIAVRQRIGLEHGERWLCCLPLYHIGGLAILFRCLEAGAAMVLHESFAADAVWRDLHTQRITHLSLVPAMLAQLLVAAQGNRPPAHLRAVVIGGSAADARLIDAALALGWPLCLSYGMTETASQIATRCLSASGDGDIHSVGRPLGGVQAEVVPCQSERTSGTLRLRGEMVMLGYANPGLETGEGLVDGWFETQDEGCMDERGHLHIMGRSDVVIVSGGENIHPHRLESFISACAGLDEVGITGRADPHWGEIVVALFVGTIDADELERWCREHLPSHLRPRQFIQLETLPKTALGKLDRPALHRLLSEKPVNVSEH